MEHNSVLRRLGLAEELLVRGDFLILQTYCEQIECSTVGFASLDLLGGSPPLILRGRRAPVGTVTLGDPP